MLAIIPKKETLKGGIPCAKRAIKIMLDVVEKDQTKWDIFWVCFKKFWCSDMKFVETWKTHDEYSNGHPEIHDRTNNGLER